MASVVLRLGFIPLIDAAPLIAASRCGFFADEGLAVTLHRQIGWANIRDKLSFRHLDAAHALLGMPLASYMGRDSFAEPLIAVMGLGSGGNAITIRRELFEAGAQSAADLAALLKKRPGAGRWVAGHVLGSSMHHYLLREWLSSGGIDPDHDAKLCVIPPSQMTDHMRGGFLDVFCVGEPWNTVAARSGVGATLVSTTDILPRHPEKVLAISQRFAVHAGGIGGKTITALVRAVLRGSLWCAELTASGREGELAAMLARPEYLAQPAEVLRQSLCISRDLGASRSLKNARPANWTARSFSPELSGGTFPNKMHAVWMMREMIRWGHLHPGADIAEIADRCCDTAAYRAATKTLGIVCPPDDFAPMELRGGKYLRLENIRDTDRTVARHGPDADLKTQACGASPACIA